MNAEDVRFPRSEKEAKLLRKAIDQSVGDLLLTALNDDDPTATWCLERIWPIPDDERGFHLVEVGSSCPQLIYYLTRKYPAVMEQEVPDMIFQLLEDCSGSPDAGDEPECIGSALLLKLEVAQCFNTNVM